MILSSNLWVTLVSLCVTLTGRHGEACEKLIGSSLRLGDTISYTASRNTRSLLNTDNAPLLHNGHMTFYNSGVMVHNMILSSRNTITDDHKFRYKRIQKVRKLLFAEFGIDNFDVRLMRLDNACKGKCTLTQVIEISLTTKKKAMLLDFQTIQIWMTDF